MTKPDHQMRPDDLTRALAHSSKVQQENNALKEENTKLLEKLADMERQVESSNQARLQAVHKHDGMVASLRELQQQLEEARGWSQEDRAKHFFKQPEVIARLGQIKDQVEAAWRQAFETAKDHILTIADRQEKVENANYWLNKVRTDEDHEDAIRQVGEAEEALLKAIDEAKKFASSYQYIPTSALKEGPPEGQHG